VQNLKRYTKRTSAPDYYLNQIIVKMTQQQEGKH